MSDLNGELIYASGNGDVEKVQQLLKNGANIDTKNNRGETPLHYASWYGKENVARLLLEHDGNIDAQNNEGSTPLNYASCNGKENVVAFLIEHDANIGAKDNHGNTPLHDASRKGNEDVVKLLLEKGANPNITNNNGKTPLQLAREYNLQEEKQRLEKQQEEEEARKRRHQNHDNIREQLRLVMEKKQQDPVKVTSSYISEINTGERIGKGYFGVVEKGFDRVLGKEVALKKVDMQVFENASPLRIQGIQKSFQNEMNILSKLDHPNIARLYGFYFNPNNIAEMCLIYELAANGSLDGFWKDDHQRQRLSTGQTRVRIAYEVAMVLRYMHEGLDGQAVCFHRDIKSGNVCLASDFTVRIIDCGLSKYIEENEEQLSSSGGIGTKGYIAPDYNDDEIDYDSSCDVFSFGVFLCELITGTTNPSGKNGYYIAFEKKKMKRLADCVDPCIEWDETTRDRLVELALECIKANSEDRPRIGNVLERLRHLLYAGPTTTQTDPVGASEIVPPGPKCRICGRDNIPVLQCFGSTPHTHCSECVERSLVRSIVRGQEHRFCCLKEGCDSRDFHLDEVEKHISLQSMSTYSLHSTLTGLMSEMNERIDTSLRLQAQLCAGNGLRCPRRFILVEADRDGIRPWRNPREWLRNAKSVKLYLYFVCSHSNELVSDENRIKLRYTHEDLMKIAPALNASLFLLQLATPLVDMAPVTGTATVSSSVDKILDAIKLKEMDEWSRELLAPNDLVVLDRARKNGNVIDDRDVQQLVGPALSLVAEKAAERDNVGWHSELIPAFDFETKEATFIKRGYQLDPRYNQWKGS